MRQPERLIGTVSGYRHPHPGRARSLIMSGMTGITFNADRLREIGERYGVARLEVFGSVGRGEGRSDSDLDLLYELKPGSRLGFAFFELEDELTELFGRPVDLVARDAVNEHIRPQILHDARPFYAA